jgi:hypothetical protein
MISFWRCVLRCTAAAVTGLLLAAPASGRETNARVMLVATYHFANPGQDIHNVKAVDVLAPERQSEIEAVTRSLARFEPNRVAVEWPADVVDERYARYRNDSLPVSSNEVVQLGFRLARARGLERVHGIDVAGDFPFEPVAAWAKRHGQTAQLDAMMAAGAAEVARISDLQQRTSIGGVLRYMNEPAGIALNHAFYPPLLRMGAGQDQPGATLISAWYARNLAICARLLQIIEPGDRIAVFYGQGHVYLLRQCVTEQPDVELVDPLTYLTLGAGP